MQFYRTRVLRLRMTRSMITPHEITLKFQEQTREENQGTDRSTVNSCPDLGGYSGRIPLVLYLWLEHKVFIPWSES